MSIKPIFKEENKIVIILVVLSLVGLILFFIRTFVNRNWTLIYTTIGYEEYFRITGRLRAGGIRYKTITPQSGFEHQRNRFKDNTQYDIYVKKEEEHLAYRVLQENK